MCCIQCLRHVMVLPHRPIVPFSVISPYVVSILVIISQYVLSSPSACCEIASGADPGENLTGALHSNFERGGCGGRV